MSLVAAFDNVDVVKILGYGVIGLGLLLAMLAFWLLQREQSKTNPDEKILKSVQMFMIFSVVLCLIGVGAQFLDQSKASSSQQERIKTLSDEIKPKDDEITALTEKLTMLTNEVNNQAERRRLIGSKLHEIDLALIDKEFDELQSLVADTDAVRRERLKRTIDGLKLRLSEAIQLVEQE